MDYRNLAEEELKLRIAEQFFPTYGLCLPHRQDRFYRRRAGAKGARPVRATSGQGEDHTGDKGVACYAPTETPRTHRDGRPYTVRLKRNFGWARRLYQTQISIPS